MYKIMEYTAIVMEKVKPYGVFHLSFLLIGLLVSIFIAYKLRNLDNKKMNKVLFGLGIFLFLCELYKQLFYTYYIGNGSYQYWIFPFQLCSIPMYLCLIIPFIKNDKIVKAIYTFLISYNFLGGFISFLEPSGLIHEYLFLTLHAFIWHMSIVLIGLIIGLNKNNKFSMKDFKNNILLFLSMCLIAFLINIVLRGPSNASINMFFIGPSLSPLVVFHDIAAKYGWYINSIIYILVITFGAFLFYLPFTKKKLTEM